MASDELIVLKNRIGPTAESEVVHSELEKIRNSNKQKRLMPQDVVKKARRATHPLHKHFEWDDEIAGEKFRLAQASLLIAAVVKVVDHGDGPKRVQNYVPMRHIRKNDPGGYEPANVVVKRKTDRERMIEKAMRKVQVAIAELQAIEDLTGLSVDIENLITKHGLSKYLE